MKYFLILIFLFSGIFSTVSAQEPEFDLDMVFLTSLNGTVTQITHAGDERLFALEKPGRIRVFYRDGSQIIQPFLNIEDRVDNSANEQGLLGLAFPSDYCSSGLFYVNYTADVDGQLVTRVSRFSVSDTDENLGDPESEEILMEFDQDFANHNGGHIEFGPDGYLYIGTGDGGSGGDPNNRAQDITSYLGKLLRIDVSQAPGYVIPEDNPYINDDFGQDEIWAYGLRNPWKFAFDGLTGDLFIADVGQSEWEEVNFDASEYTAGRNYGWRCYEADDAYDLSECSGGDYTFPVFEYNHNSSGFFHCSVTGGRVYRGPSFPDFFGYYFLTDLCSGYFWALTSNNGEVISSDIGTAGVSNVTTFGEDIWGEVYLANASGNVYRLEDAGTDLLSPIILSSEGNTQLSSLLEGSSYSWSLNGSPVGESTQIIDVEANGTYGLIVTTPEGCEVDAGTIEVDFLSVSDHPGLEKLMVYPNPSEEYLQVEFKLHKDIQDELSVQIFDLEGRLVISKRLADTNEKVITINTSQLSGGIYTMTLRSEKAILGNRKIVKL